MLNKEIVEKLVGKRILITGATGLIGSSLIKLLTDLNKTKNTNITIYALVRNKNILQEKFPNIKNDLNIIESDVCDTINVGVDYIIHAASPAHPLAYSTMPVDVMKANLLGTINMLELAKQNKAKLVFISSGEIYGISDNINAAFKENEYGYTDILNPRSCYPESKRAAETLCSCYHSQFGVSAKIARLCHVYGPLISNSNTRADSQFLRNVINGQNIVMKSNGQQIRSFCYVNDAVEGILYILIKGNDGEAYNIANKNSIATVREYAEILASIGNVKIENDYPKDVENKGYSKISRAVLDSTKLENLGWSPKYDLKKGLKDTVEFYKK